jgi:hypothetical protein
MIHMVNTLKEIEFEKKKPARLKSRGLFWCAGHGATP